MRVGFGVVAITAFLSTPGVWAQSSECFPQSKADQYIRDFKIDTETFTDGKDLCKQESQLVTLLDTIDFLKTVKFEDKLQEPFVKGLLPTDYYSYIKNHPQGLVGPVARCPGDACLHPTGRAVILGKAFFAQPKYMRASTLIHEYRHADNAFPHVECEQGLEKGNSKSCDPSLEMGGSYAVQMEYLSRLVLFAKDLPASDRVAVKGFALHLAQNKFNRSALKSRLVVALVDKKDGRISLFDGVNEYQMGETQLSSPGKLISRDRNFNILYDDRSKASELFDPYFKASILTSDNPDVLGKAFIDYNSLWPEGQRGALLDAIRYGDKGAQALLFPGAIQIVIGGRVTRQEFPVLSAGSRFLRDVPCIIAELNAPGALVIEFGGQLQTVNVSNPVLARVDNLDCAWPKEWLDYARLSDGVELALTRDGALVNAAKGNEPIAAMAGRTFTQMVRMKEPFFMELMER